jgi:hypothetical protein
MNIRLPWLSREKTGLAPEFSVRKEPYGPLHLTARAEQPLVTQALLEAVRAARSPLGLVLVEAEGAHREWAVPRLQRTLVLHALVTLRDLFGVGLLDVAVFSPQEGLEIYLDRFGTLEIRAGSWEEPRLRSLLEGRGFQGVVGLSMLPQELPAPTAWNEESRERYAHVQWNLEKHQGLPETS